MLIDISGPILQTELMQMLGLQKSARKLVRKAVADLEDAGFLRFNRKNRMSVDRSEVWLIATCYRNTEGGHYLVTEKTDCVLIAGDIEANQEDRLLLRKAGKQWEVRDVLTRKEQTYIGIYIEDNGVGFFIPQEGGQDHIRVRDSDIRVRPMDLVLCVMEGKERSGRIIEVLHDNPTEDEPDLFKTCETRGLPVQFPKEIKKEAESIREGERELGRTDLTDLLTFTIDGENAKDLDDAISVERIADGYRVGVHIADVSHYVKEGGEIDFEAYRRGVSVYFPDRNVPMLPRRLSDDLCSLHPGKPKRTLSVFMDFDADGTQTGFNIEESMILSKARLTYEEVSDFLEGEMPTLEDRTAGLDQALLDAHLLAESISRESIAGGKIRFGIPRVSIGFSPDGDPVLASENRRVANRLIEALMVRANETVARYVNGAGRPFLYRTHEAPRADRLSRLVRFMDERGYFADFEGASAREFQNVMNEMKKTTHENAAEQLLVESMVQAKYHTYPDGHFGLGIGPYCHFTSPIRRYADLVCHRVVKDLIRSGPSMRQDDPLRFREMAGWLSHRERIAEAAEGDVRDDYVRMWGRVHAGEVYTGRIAEIGPRFVRVLLDNGAAGQIYLQEDMVADGDGFTVQFGSERLEIGSKIGVRIREVEQTGIVFSYLFRESAIENKHAFNTREAG